MSNQVLDPATTNGPLAQPEDRLMPTVAYGFYFVGLFTALPILLGAIVAYVMRGQAGHMARTHYTYLIATFWGSIALWILGAALIIVGLPLSLVLIGIPLVAVGWGVVSVVWLWVLVRLVVGSVYLLRGDAHPRPNAWLI